MTYYLARWISRYLFRCTQMKARGANEEAAAFHVLNPKVYIIYISISRVYLYLNAYLDSYA